MASAASAGVILVADDDADDLFLMRRLMDRVERFNDHGNVVRLTLLRG